MNKPILEDPKTTVLAFAKAYTDWELKMKAAEKDEVNGLDNPELTKICDKIISDYCTAKKRVYVDGVYSYSSPPTYAKVTADNVVNVESVTRSRTYVDTNQLDSHAYRFVVLKKKDGWRIDSVKWKFYDNPNWENTLIGS